MWAAHVHTNRAGMQAKLTTLVQMRCLDAYTRLDHIFILILTLSTSSHCAMLRAHWNHSYKLLTRCAFRCVLWYTRYVRQGTYQMLAHLMPLCLQGMHWCCSRDVNRGAALQKDGVHAFSSHRRLNPSICQWSCFSACECACMRAWVHGSLLVVYVCLCTACLHCLHMFIHRHEYIYISHACCTQSCKHFHHAHPYWQSTSSQCMRTKTTARAIQCVFMLISGDYCWKTHLLSDSFFCMWAGKFCAIWKHVHGITDVHA